MRKSTENTDILHRQQKGRKSETGVLAGIERKIRKTVGLVCFAGACAGAGALWGAAEYFYKYALTPGKHDVRLDEDPVEKDYVAGRKWLKNHDKKEDVWIRADDGLCLHGYFIAGGSAAGGSATGSPAAKDKGSVEHRYALCIHGYADASDGMGLYARVYHDRYGMNVVLPDQRGHGLSDGNYVGMGGHESLDMLRWIDWILERDRDAQIIMHGISMGAATVLMTTGHTLPEQVAAAVSDAAYSDTMEELIHVYVNNEKRGKVVPAPVMAQAVRAVALCRAGYDIARVSPVRAVAQSSTPTLFIHGQADDFVPPEMMPVLYRAAACPKAFLWIPEAGHVQSVVVDPETYWARVERFLHNHGVEL